MTDVERLDMRGITEVRVRVINQDVDADLETARVVGIAWD